MCSLETIKVPAGTFEAYKVNIKKQQKSGITFQQYWFAPKVGIVKEIGRIYSGGLLHSRTTIELVNREIPE